MKFRILSTEAKIFVELTTILFLVRVVSASYVLDKIKVPRHYGDPSERYDEPSPDTSELVTSKPLSKSWKAETRKPLERNPEWMITSLPEISFLKTDIRNRPIRNSEKINVSQHMTNFLSPNTLSHPDLFQYLLRELSKLPTPNVMALEVVLQSRLKNNKISENIMPYARALKSIIETELYLQHAKRFLEGLRYYRRGVPPEVSSPSGLSPYGFFSSDFFADPDVPYRLINKLMEFPKSEIPNVSIQLQNYAKMMQKWGLEKWGLRYWDYQYYAETLEKFLKSDLLNDLKRNMAEIQRISDPNENSTDGGKMNGEIGSSVM